MADRAGPAGVDRPVRRVLALTKYGDHAASTRQRFAQYAGSLTEAGIALEIAPLFDNDVLDALYAGRSRCLGATLGAYRARGRLISAAGSRDLIWVYCEAFPYLPGVVERLVARLGIPIVYDFDDAIFHQYDRHPNPLVRQLLGRKLEPLLRHASLATCGNAYLQDYAGRLCSRTAVVPTVVDTEVYRPGRRAVSRARTLGWIGSPSTWHAHLKPHVAMWQRLAEELDLTIRVVGAGPEAVAAPRFEFVEWSEATEVALIQGMDIGIMPLPDDPWARGKCGYKLIQYMGCGLPVVASPVGVNAEIVEHGRSGFLARDPGDWAEAIRRLAADPDLRASMGRHGRDRVERDYSLRTHGPRLARLMRDVADARRPAANR